MNEQEIKELFIIQLPEYQDQLEKACNDLSSLPGDDQKKNVLTHALHRLAGSALSVGYSRIGNIARNAENLLKQTAPSDPAAVEDLITTLKAEIKAHIRDEECEYPKFAEQSIKNIPSLQETRSMSLIYLVEDDPAQADLLASQVRHFGYNLQSFNQLQDLRAALNKELPAAILMDIIFPEGDMAGIDTIQTLQAEYKHQLPVFFLSIREDLPARLQAIRAGSGNYFVKPVDVGAIVDALDKIINIEEPEKYRVLIVDDSEVISKIISMHLKKVGMDTRIVTDPVNVIRTLEQFTPDLLLLDLYMPGCTGMELAQVIRQIPTFVSLPIVYLSSETDREKQLAALNIGGDDFLTKPIKPDHLVSSVTSRIRRYRQLRTLMMRDGLTGLLNHTSIRERLGQEIARASRDSQPLALAMIDIDNFKLVNDTYGHAEGDRILKALTHMLNRRLRQSDIIGRYGGEEFVVILPNTDEETALTLLNDLRESFSLVRHIANGKEFSVTFSCGVASFSNQQTPANLSEAADKAMYVAKKQGRNRVILAE